MRCLLNKICLGLLLCFIPFSGFAQLIEYIENVDNAEYEVNSEYLQLISGKLFLNCSNGLISLKNLRYDNDNLFVTPKALVVYCYECESFYILGYMHTCNGVLK